MRAADPHGPNAVRGLPRAYLARVTRARHRLSEAAAAANSSAVANALDELELALGLARESGVDVPHAGHKGTQW